MNSSYQNEENAKKLRRKLPIVVLTLVLIAVLGTVAYKIVDKGHILSADEADQENTINVVEFGGEKYQAKTRVKTYLFIGTDSTGKAEAKEEYDGTGQCDVLELVVIDQNADTYTVLPINRDTITAVKSLEDDGTYIATSDVQIALAHAMGDGMEISCENTVDAVSNYLYGQKIDGYAAFNIDTIGIINHLAGGVTVTIEDDFSEEDPSLTMGETITLSDEQAENYVRGRMSVADGTNANRMKRQKTFLDEVQKIFKEKASQDESFAIEAYDALQDYMVTNLTKKDFSKLAKAMVKDESLGELEIQGESSIDYHGYNQFIPDADSLEEVVIQLFYDKI
jgi:anionic cell wall polymer biosynthesis LytR-Cps2A-Psr (LCP) family protein